MTKNYFPAKSLILQFCFSMAISFSILITPALAHGKAKVPPPVIVNATTVGVSATAADNTANINKALKMIGSKGTVYFPAGTYKFAGPLVLGAGQSFAGAGASTILFANNYTSAGGSVLAMSGSGCTVSALTLQAANPTGGGQQLNGITIKNAASFAVENVKFTSNLNDAISVSDSNVGTISGNVFNSGSQYNLYGVDVNSLVIEHNTFNQIGPYAVDIAPSSTNTLSAISILSNQFNYTQIQGNQLGAISVSGISSSSINSNTFSLPAAAPTNTYRGAIALTGGGSVGKCINVAIESNLCNCNAPQGNATISISGNGSSLAVENIYVEANTINMSAAWPSNTEMPSAIWAYGSAGSMKNIQVIANSIKAPGQAWPVGIMAGASPASDAANDISGLNISKNIINGCSYGIYVDGSTTTTVDSNSITGCQGDGIYVDYNTAGTLAVIGNNVSNCGLAPTNSGNLNWYNETAAIMVVGSTVYGVTIEKNTYGTAAQANNLMFFLFCDVPSMQKVATAKNVTTTTLPSYISL